jgi:hypothetical protein
MRWIWAGGGHLRDLEVELHPSTPLDVPLREESLREVRALVLGFRHRDPHASRLFLSVYEALVGPGAIAPRAASQALDVTDPRAAAMGDELLFAARAGLVVARRRALRSVVVPLEESADAALGPASSDEAAPPSTSWIGLVLLDQNGVPVPGRTYRVIAPDGTKYEGQLDSNGTAFVRSIPPGNCQVWCPYQPPRPPIAYSVQQGDHASGIAENAGYDDYTVLWNDPGNSDLQSQRTDPHVLVPGDTVNVPEIKEVPPVNKATGAKYPFTISKTPLRVRMKMLDLAAEPQTQVPVTVAGVPLTTDGTGLVQTDVDKLATSLPVTAPDATYTLSVGAINPADDTTEAGYKARLFNLGFLWDPTVDDTDDEMVIALQDFQAQYSLTISGQLDDATKAQLTQVYGS